MKSIPWSGRENFGALVSRNLSMERHLTPCVACDLVMQELKKELFDLGWQDSLHKLASLASNFDFLDRYPDYGASLDITMMRLVCLMVITFPVTVLHFM